MKFFYWRLVRQGFESPMLHKTILVLTKKKVCFMY
nr:MAG TPA: hypothetical protein [Crassvirales sp.]